MSQEIERKYLVKNDSWRNASTKKTTYTQAYLSVDPARSVRIRKGEKEAYLTVKGESRGVGRAEFEYSIPLDDAEQMIKNLCARPPIEKTRHIVMHDGLRWEIDEFAGANAGLVIAEVELETDDEPTSKPEWIGKDVTGDPRYHNLSLVSHPHTKWAERAE